MMKRSMKMSFLLAITTCVLAFALLLAAPVKESQAASLGQVKNLTINSQEKKIILKWNKVTGASSYQIYRAKSANGTYKKVGTTSLTKFVNKYYSQGPYYYKVRAIKGSTRGAFSAKKRIYPICCKIVSQTVKPGYSLLKVSVTNNGSKSLYFWGGVGYSNFWVTDKAYANVKARYNCMVSNQYGSAFIDASIVKPRATQYVYFIAYGLTSKINTKTSGMLLSCTFNGGTTKSNYLLSTAAFYNIAGYTAVITK